MSDDRDKITVHLFGLFGIIAPDGTDLTPKSAKAQAMIAILCRSPNSARARAWLQDKLWSDRGREQGASSLRQALLDARSSLGTDWVKALNADRKTVSLDTECINLAPRQPGQDLLEGMDVKDREFEDWLTLERAVVDREAFDSTSSAMPAMPATHRTQPVSVVVLPMAGGDPFDRLFSEIVVGEISNYLRDSYCLLVQSGDSVRMLPALSVFARVSCASENGEVLTMVTCQGSIDGPIIWSGSRRIKSSQGAPPLTDLSLAQLVHETCEIIAENVSTSQRLDAASMVQRLNTIKMDIFSLQKERIKSAQARLENFEGPNAPETILAWRIIADVVVLMERLADDPEATRERLAQLLKMTGDLTPGSMLLSAISYAQSMVFCEIPAAAENARRAVYENGANPLAWLATGLVQVHLGNLDWSHACVMRARMIDERSARRHWWDGMAAISATAISQFDDAKALSKASHSLAPGFKMPMRYLIALLHRDHEEEEKYGVIQSLSSVEPDFSFERLTMDPDYPAETLRKTGVLNAK